LRETTTDQQVEIPQQGFLKKPKISKATQEALALPEETNKYIEVSMVPVSLVVSREQVNK
jgi:hypothetical protein